MDGRRKKHEVNVTLILTPERAGQKGGELYVHGCVHGCCDLDLRKVASLLCRTGVDGSIPSRLRSRGFMEVRQTSTLRAFGMITLPVDLLERRVGSFRFQDPLWCISSCMRGREGVEVAGLNKGGRC